MNQKNIDRLEKQLFITGFGDGHTDQLKEQIAKGEASFHFFHKAEFGKDGLTARLEFNRSITSGDYFFNRVNMALKPEGKEEVLQQNFHLNFKDKPITLKEGYNLLSGRAVHKELTNAEGEKYTAWQQLDFKQMDDRGNFKIRQYHQNWNFDLRAALEKIPVKELETPVYKENLIRSLERGNRQSVTYNTGDKEIKVFLEAAPQYRSIKINDENMKRVMAKELKPAQEQQASPSQKQEARQAKSRGASTEAEGEGKQGKEKKRKPSHSL